MTLLSESLSNFLQFLTLPAEIIGISLALIDFRFPEVAQRANRNYLKIKLWERRNSLFSLQSMKENWEKGLPKGVRTDGRSNVLASRIVMLISYAVIALFVLLLLASVVDVLIIDLPLNGGNALIAVVIITVLSMIIALFVRLIPDRPIAGMGFLLAALGVVGEIYQMMVYLKYEGDIVGKIGAVAAILFVVGFFATFFAWSRNNEVDV